MVSHTVYFKGMMVFTLTSQMYHRISVLAPVLVRVPEYLSTSTSTSTSTMTLELTSTSTVRVQEIQYSSTASTSTEYEYPSPGWNIVNWTLRINFSEILIKIHTFSSNKMHLKMLSGKCRPFCLGLNMLKHFKISTLEFLILRHCIPFSIGLINDTICARIPFEMRHVTYPHIRKWSHTY